MFLSFNFNRRRLIERCVEMPIQAVSFKGSEHVSKQAENKKEYTDLEYYQALSDAGLSTMDVYEPVNSEGKKNKKGLLGVALSLATAAVFSS